MKAGRTLGGPFIVLRDSSTTDPTFYFWTRSKAGVWSLAAATFQHHQGANGEAAVIGRGALIVPSEPQIGLYGGGKNTFMVSGAIQDPFNTCYRSADGWASYAEGTAPGSEFPQSTAAAAAYPAWTDANANSAFKYFPFVDFARSASGRIVAVRASTAGSVNYDLETIIVYSDDNGATWNKITRGSSLPANTLLSASGVAYSPTLDRFVAAVDLGGVSANALYSNDGITWEDSGLSGFGVVSCGCVWTGTHFVLFASGGGIAARRRSTDGISWGASGGIAGVSGSALSYSAADGAGIVVASGPVTGAVVRSTNHGDTWATVTITGTLQNSRAVRWWPADSAFWRMGTAGLIRSATGASGTWSSQTLPTAPAITRELITMAFPPAS